MEWERTPLKFQLKYCLCARRGVGVTVIFLRRKRREYVVRKGVEFRLTSPAFEDGARIPRRYTCDGEDVSPPLEWEGAPTGTKAYALIMYDPDAPLGTFIHWVLYNIPASVNRLEENVPKVEVVEGVGVQGVNDFGGIGYGGPCPPPGHGDHRYYFALHALDSQLDLPPRLKASEVLKHIEPHVIGYAILMGKYSR